MSAPVDLAAVAVQCLLTAHRRRGRGAARAWRPSAAWCGGGTDEAARGTTARDRRAGTHQGRFLAVVLLVGLGFAAARRPARAGAAGRPRRLPARRRRRSTPAPWSCPPCAAASSTAQGQVLADNRASTVVTIERRVIADSDDRGAAVVRDVASVLGLPADALLGRTWLCGEEGAPPAPACWAGSPQVPVPLAEDVDADPGPVAGRAARRASRAWPSSRARCGSTRDRSASVRRRPSATSGQVRAEEVGGERGLVADDLVGRSGLEQQYDAVLRGVPGRTVVSVDAARAGDRGGVAHRPGARPRPGHLARRAGAGGRREGARHPDGRGAHPRLARRLRCRGRARPAHRCGGRPRERAGLRPERLDRRHLAGRLRARSPPRPPAHRCCRGRSASSWPRRAR